MSSFLLGTFHMATPMGLQMLEWGVPEKVMASAYSIVTLVIIKVLYEKVPYFDQICLCEQTIPY